MRHLADGTRVPSRNMEFSSVSHTPLCILCKQMHTIPLLALNCGYRLTPESGVKLFTHGIVFVLLKKKNQISECGSLNGKHPTGSQGLALLIGAVLLEDVSHQGALKSKMLKPGPV